MHDVLCCVHLSRNVINNVTKVVMKDKTSGEIFGLLKSESDFQIKVLGICSFVVL